MTHLADKREARLRAVGISGVPTHRACFARVVGIDLDGHASSTHRFVGDHAVQFGKGPFGVGGIGLALLAAGLFAASALRSFSDVGQVFQPDQAVGVLLDDAFGNDMIGVGFQPSLSPGDHHQTAGRGASAFLLQALSQSRLMVAFGDNAIAGMKTRLPLRITGHGQVAHAHIYPDDASQRLRNRVGHLHDQRNQQVELLLELVVIELGSPDGCALCNLGHVVVVARVGQDDPPGQRRMLTRWSVLNE